MINASLHTATGVNISRSHIPGDQGRALYNARFML
jgi:hypothetical protein